MRAEQESNVNPLTLLLFLYRECKESNDCMSPFNCVLQFNWHSLYKRRCQFVMFTHTQYTNYFFYGRKVLNRPHIYWEMQTYSPMGLPYISGHFGSSVASVAFICYCLVCSRPPRLRPPCELGRDQLCLKYSSEQPQGHTACTAHVIGFSML